MVLAVVFLFLFLFAPRSNARNYTLRVSTFWTMVGGRGTFIRGFNDQFPGPTITCFAGEELRVRVINAMSSEDVSGTAFLHERLYIC